MSSVSWWRTAFGDEEIDGIAHAIRNEYISQGPVVEEFEALLGRYLGVPYVVATTSCSMSQLMAFMALGVGPGDEIIVPDRTWISAAHAALVLGATVKLVDVEAERQVMDMSRLEESITPRTKVIVPTHLNGQTVDMGRVRTLADKYGLLVVEDAAQALGSRNRDGLLGTQSDLGCFSLSVAKIIATGQGGFIATRDKAFYEKLVSIRAHGVSNVLYAQWTGLGLNFRFNDILASIGIAQLRHIDERIEKVKALYGIYEEGLKNIPYLKFLPVNSAVGEVPLYIQVLCKERNRLIARLQDEGIQARPFYPSLHHARYLDNPDGFPNSELFGKEGVTLPSGPAQSVENVHSVLEVLGTPKMMDCFAVY
jgi:dTDP-4-amino-4,6-dideoxygalactose transaminase